MIALLAVALAGDPVHGEALAALAGCPACHTAPDGAPYAGGHAVETKFGTFFGTNLTPDVEHGLGTWSEADFVRAMRDGRAPDGRAYWPAFPYPSFTHMDDADLADLWAWLRALPPDPRPDTLSVVRPRLRGGLGLWRLIAFRPAREQILDRGQYLVDAVAHCGECHTPRSSIGAPIGRRYLGGNPDLGAPAIDPAALAGWSEGDVVTFLESGMTPEGDVTGGEMRRVVRDGTSRLSEDDRRAIAGWLLAPEPPPARR
ncbi:MAG TPA: cytochrome c [Myxococcota bacterium]|nr:cytochrome c [Myxococcota bacterium]